MNIDQQRQLIQQLGNSIYEYVNHKNSLCDESFFDISDLEERIAFLTTMYENYKNVNEEMRIFVSGCIGNAMLSAKQFLNEIKLNINTKATAFDDYFQEKIQTLPPHQQDIVYKNYSYIKALFKNDTTYVGKIQEDHFIDKQYVKNLRKSTYPAIWHKVTQALNGCNNNAIRFRDCIIDMLKSENQERSQECENMRNSFLNAQSNLALQFADTERRMAGRQNQPVTDNNLGAIMQQLYLGH